MNVYREKAKTCKKGGVKVYVRIVTEMPQDVTKNGIRGKCKMPWIHSLYFIFQKASNSWGLYMSSEIWSISFYH